MLPTNSVFISVKLGENESLPEPSSLIDPIFPGLRIVKHRELRHRGAEQLILGPADLLGLGQDHVALVDHSGRREAHHHIDRALQDVDSRAKRRPQRAVDVLLDLGDFLLDRLLVLAFPDRLGMVAIGAPDRFRKLRDRVRLDLLICVRRHAVFEHARGDVGERLVQLGLQLLALEELLDILRRHLILREADDQDEDVLHRSFGVGHGGPARVQAFPVQPL
jgi:hypothetical protein